MKNNTQKPIVKEPEGVDFLVKSTPWTPEEQAEFSDFLRQRKDIKRKESLGKTRA
jgi:hypothetical protein